MVKQPAHNRGVTHAKRLSRKYYRTPFSLEPLDEIVAWKPFKATSPKWQDAGDAIHQ
jgi:hypothetical protein